MTDSKNTQLDGGRTPLPLAKGEAGRGLRASLPLPNPPLGRGGNRPDFFHNFNDKTTIS